MRVAKNLGREKKQQSATKSNLRKEGLFQKALSKDLLKTFIMVSILSCEVTF